MSEAIQPFDLQAQTSEGPLQGATSRTMPLRLVRRAGESTGPLSVAQEQLWYLTRLAPDLPVYNEAVAIHKTGSFDLSAFRHAFNQLVRRHEAWRTTFPAVDGEPQQLVLAPEGIDLPLLDLTQLGRSDAERVVAGLIAGTAAEPYDLARGPLLRARLIRFSPDHHRLYLALHHLIFDGVTLYRVVLPELIELYDAAVENRATVLAEPGITYIDYAKWERKWIDSPRVARRLRYWRQHLLGAPRLDLPLDHPRPPSQRFRGAMEALTVPKDTVDGLKAFADAHGATLFQVVAAAFAVLLHRYTGQDDVIFGTATDLRQRPEFQALVGYCLTSLVLRCDVSDDPSFPELVSRVRETLIDGLDNLVPFERLVRELQPQRDRRVNPIFQAMLILEPPAVSPEPGWSIHQMEIGIGNAIGHAKFDLSLELDERTEGHMAGRLIYNIDLFEPDTAERMIGHWLNLLAGITMDPHRPVGALPLLTEAELTRQLVEWNATTTEHAGSGATVDALVAEQVARTPDAVAIVAGETSLTYAELDQRASRVADRLRALGVGPGDLVAMHMERSPAMVVGLLGILRAGGAYLPLDPIYPPDRIAFMIRDSGAVMVVTEEALATRSAEWGLEMVVVDSPELGREPSSAGRSGSRPEDLMYVLYTSGSTGTPKGVAVPHRAVVNLLTSLAAEPGMTSRDTVLAVTTMAFDIAVVEIWLPLVTGARIVLATPVDAADGSRLAQLIRRWDVSFMQATPSTWQLMVESGWEGKPDLRALCGGETLQQQLADQLLDRCAVLWNMFGPTETTVWSTIARVTPGAPILIGRPIANTRTYIVDRAGGMVPAGVAGELLIAGDGVATGYVNRPELTAARFGPEPLVDGARAYRTGDLARYRPGGQIEHLGRLDNQVKLRGYRIEPGEIEAILLAQATIAAAVVIAREDVPGEQRLIAYLIAAGPPPDEAELRSALRKTLPVYMVPSQFVFVDEFPRTSNGKLDRNALPAPDLRPVSRALVPATTPVEAALTTMWAEILGLAEIGVDDDFFDNGGHSLLAVKLIARAEQRFGTEIPLNVMISNGFTVRTMSSVISSHGLRSSAAGEADRARAARTIVFFVHPSEQAMLTLRHFIGPLGRSYDIIGLLANRKGWRIDRSGSIEELAEPLLASIREAQPTGPYCIGGYSFGGLLAYEIASRLEAEGESIAWLGLVDTLTPAAARPWRTQRERMRRAFARGPRYVAQKTTEVVKRQISIALVRLGLADPTIFDWAGATALALKYRCPANRARLELFLPDDERSRDESPSRGWADLHRGPLRLHDVPGDHSSMVEQPHVATLAAAFACSLREATRGSWDGGGEETPPCSPPSHAHSLGSSC